MSKTDKTRPWRVKLLDSPRNFKEEHNHGKVPLRDERGEIVRVLREGAKWPSIVYTQATECDLPPDPTKDTERRTNCYWTHTAEWAANGQAFCGCPMCTSQDWRREERRRERYEGKRQARDWQREYTDG